MNQASLAQDLRSVLAEYPGAEVGVSVGDPATGVSLDLNGDKVFHAASTMKVAVMIELYRRAAAGDFSLEDSLEIRNEFVSILDGSRYAIDDDSDVEIYSRIGEEMSIRDLTYRLITSSSNLATNLLIELATADSVQRTIDRMGVKHMKVLRGVQDLEAFEAGLNNETTANDLRVLLLGLMQGRVVSAEASREMVRIMMDEPWNEMIKGGLPAEVVVAHKTGTITAHHHDAAIVMPSGRDPYVLVVLTRGLEDRETSSDLGRRLSEIVYRHLRG